ncbi:MAG TPA: arginine--tRNA ligase, partial [Candidatus Marinimicrobia bacterium]|nr:arginine--tRNA ligase [Candidatus Neomarinimicrobiota bacterium]
MSIVDLKVSLQQHLAETLQSLELPAESIIIETSRSAQFGDLSSNVALVLAREAGRPPLELAEAIREQLIVPEDTCSAVTVSKPGFINFSISETYLRNQISEILTKGEDYGKSEAGEGKRALVEFVSANPTGPLTVGHGRQAVLGDVVSNILELHGYDVTREYYFNDAGRQMRLLGESVRARYLELLGEDASVPEGGYEGSYIRDIAEQMVQLHGDSLKQQDDMTIFKQTAEKVIFSDIKATLAKIGLEFDNFMNEKTFYEDGTIDRVVEGLREKGLAYDKDGAVWFKTTQFGKDQDTVLIKGTGEPTYRLPDIAYHTQKVTRGYDYIIDIFGADHKDTYPDVLSALEVLGYGTDHITVLIHQFVSLKESGQKVKMSTRKATFVTLEELIDRVGADVVRYFFIMRNMHSHLNFDLTLAIKESDENPVYYLQYAHARICNIL